MYCIIKISDKGKSGLSYPMMTNSELRERPVNSVISCYGRDAGTCYDLECSSHHNLKVFLNAVATVIVMNYCESRIIT